MYDKLCSFNNIIKAFKKARKGKTKQRYVRRFEKDLRKNILKLRERLLTQTYNPHRLKNFIHRDPKTRKISKSAFRDRVVHHILCNIIDPIFSISFINDSHANQIGKGTHRALERFDVFKRKVSKNGTIDCYVLKADIKHYFEEINHDTLLEIIKRKINDEKVLWLIRKILSNTVSSMRTNKGMPLGNITSQFFANVYLNELDQFVKHKLKVKYYIRYVDDFVILHHDKKQLKEWIEQIDNFLKEKLAIELHPFKSKVLNLENGINFLGFRVFLHFKLLRKSNMNNFERKFYRMKILFDQDLLDREKVLESFQGWLAYASHANTYKYRTNQIKLFNKSFPLKKRDLIKNIKKHQHFVRKTDESELEFSVQKTLFLFCNGLSVKDIANKRNMKESTIWEHYANLIEHNQISIWQVLPKSKIYKILYRIYSKKDRLKDIKNRLKDNSITYDEINCVLSGVKSRKKEK
jgi:retron-type reverse transcriptase|tara:strand:- start:112 stop:1506 length:1395 start_codon:yes stop_codon:yes gene_type:complete